ncbi:MAG: SIR2 family protein [Holosporales bacterium]|jgi:hypothetical protein|nr:SIR2 family protein [Holosporales bacterium]
MPLQNLTEDIARNAIRDFFREKPFIFIGSGMSCALDKRFGMPFLKDVLIERMQQQTLTDIQKNEWQSSVDAINCGVDLENALNSISDESIIQIVVKITGQFISEIDKEYAFKIANGESIWHTISLIKRLFGTLPENDCILHILTPNYDMLFEYACDYEKIPYTNGMVGGVERRNDWNAISRLMLEPCKILQNRKIKRKFKDKKHIRFYKVHGSLNYFFHDDTLIENNAWMWNAPLFVERVIITPGISKYQKIQKYRQELLQDADNAIDKSTNFLFLGYGFNDSHLDEYIKRKLHVQSNKGLIITRDANPRIESILQQSENLWIVCKSCNEKNGTRIYNKRYCDCLTISNSNLWDIGIFTQYIFGE